MLPEQARRVRLDRRSYFLLLRAYGRGGDLLGAQQVLQRMARDGASLAAFKSRACIVCSPSFGPVQDAGRPFGG